MQAFYVFFFKWFVKERWLEMLLPKWLFFFPQPPASLPENVIE